MTCFFDPQVCVMVCACFCVLYGLEKFMKTYVGLYDHRAYFHCLMAPDNNREFYCLIFLPFLECQRIGVKPHVPFQTGFSHLALCM